MRIPRLYTPQPLATGRTIELRDAPAHYLSRVLRLSPGRPVIVFNGEGGEFSGSLVSMDKKSVEVQLDEYSSFDRLPELTIELAIGLSRGERWDYVLQKATELGVSRIVPLLTERTEVKLKGERLQKKIDHWQQICISACEQCQRNRLPEITEVTALEAYLPRAVGERKFVLHHRDSQKLAAGSAPVSLSLLIGPEGGLSETEIEIARREDFAPLTLGPRVLRTETAPTVALSLVQYLWGDF